MTNTDLSGWRNAHVPFCTLRFRHPKILLFTHAIQACYNSFSFFNNIRFFMLKSFAPIINSETKILIIGTMPGEASLQAGEYYAHQRNLFWRFMADIFNNGAAFKTYKQKCACLLNNKIGLWDNLQYCERQGSLDMDIKNALPNDFEGLLQQYPNVGKIIFNGQKSAGFFKKFHPQLIKKIECIEVPSTSPANASIQLKNKFDRWKKALDK